MRSLRWRMCERGCGGRNQAKVYLERGVEIKV